MRCVPSAAVSIGTTVEIINTSSSRHGQCGVVVKSFEESGESWVTVDLEIGQLHEYLREDVAAL